MARLADKSVLVTGAGSGIGRAIAELFAAEGARVLATDLRAEAAEATAGPIGAAAMALDVREEDQAMAAVKQAVDLYGRLDALVNVAGIGSTESTLGTSLALWEEVFAVNCRGTFLMCKAALTPMIAQRRGVLVNIASVAGLVGLRQRAAYCASKGAVIAYTRALAVDHVAQGIRANAICPGTVDSPWVASLLQKATDPEQERRQLIARQPMGRLGAPQEIAQAALYLTSDESAFITGSILTIDGGMTAQ